MEEKPTPLNTQSPPPLISECPYQPANCEDCGEKVNPRKFYIEDCDKYRYYPPSRLCKKCQETQEHNEQVEGCYIYAGLEARHKTMTFDSFNLNNRSQGAWEFLKDYSIKDPIPTGNIFVSGPVGVGKTHLACAVVNALVQQKRKAKFRTTVGLLKQIKETFGPKSGNTEENVIWQLNSAPLLVLDDIGVERPTDWVKEIIYHIIDSRYNSFLPILATSNYSLGELSEKLDDRIASRLSEGRIIKLEGKDYRPGRVS